MPFPDVFKVFDSHSQDLHGMPCASGYSVLISIEGVQNLVEYFRLTANFCGQDFAMPFELKGVKCNETTYTLNNNSTDFTELRGSTSKIYTIYHNITQRKCECPDKEKRLEKAKEYGLKKLQNESLEERELRLKKHREYIRACRKNESSD